VIPFAQRNFPQEIIKGLEAVAGLSGRRPIEVFSDWVFITEATLQALPDQLRAVGATGRFAPDPPEVADTFARVRRHYDPKYLGDDRAQRVWDYFAQAFALLLEATAPGLWGEPNSLSIAGPLSGPDILGFIYQTWANGSNRIRGEIYTPWPLARLLAELTLGQSGERLVYDRLKAALCHSDNILGAATLLAGLTLPADEPGAIREYFITRVVPSTVGAYIPVTVCDPAIGTNILNLAAASLMPDWMVKLALIRFVGQDVSNLAVACSKCSAALYGLNGYALQLEATAAEALAAHRLRPGDSEPALAAAPAEAIRQVYQNGRAAPPTTGSNPGSSFEAMFRAAAGRAPAVAEAA
jgi:hypothetical protein